MSNQKRLLIEIGVVIALVLVFAVIWTSSQRRLERTLEEREATHRQALEALELASRAWAAALVHSEAQGVARSFAAGIHPMVIAGRQDSLQAAVGALVRLPGINFVHIFEPGGRVLASTDAVLRSRGEAGERAAWALESRDLRSRAGTTEGTTEIAVPIAGAEEPVAILWLAYETRRIREQARPAAP